MSSSKHILILGSGLVSPPVIHYLSDYGYRVTIASRTKSKADVIIAGLKNKDLVNSVEWDVESKDAFEALDTLTQQTDLVISLLPYLYHVQAAKIALKYKKHFCTTSYVSDAMAGLDAEAKAAGVVLLNECGVDPGLDHMSAKKIIDEVHAKGGKIISFYSLCGGLPAPDANTNPFGYKLSWSPRGVLLASRNQATFLVNGERVIVPGKDLYTEQVYRTEQVGDLGKLEWYPNRDSTTYTTIYDIPEVKTIIRGTYRNVGWCRTMRYISEYGFTSTDESDSWGGITLAKFTAKVLGGSDDEKDIKQFTADKLKLAVTDEIISKFEWIGLFSTELTVPAKIKTPLDVLCFLFERSLVYADGEKDMIAMQHTFEIEYSATHRETLTSTLIDFGQQPQGFSSMARTVSLPVGVVARAVLDGRLKHTGLLRPVTPDVYNLVLAEMEKLGVKFVEKKLAPQFWLRDEVKPGEERVAVVPSDVKKLLDAGFRVSVERSTTRCIRDEEYAAVGAELVPTGSWIKAPAPAIILGLKELPDNDDPLQHRHIYFAHCYKQQGGWEKVLSKFVRGHGILYDLEFLVDDHGRRVAAFGRPAGVVGMAVGLLQWAAQQLGEKQLQPLKSWHSTQALVDTVKGRLDQAAAKTGRHPTALVIGALGRCGGGSVWFAQQCGVKPIEWDLNETKSGGPFPELLKVDVLVNAIYLSTKIPPFITNEHIAATPDRKLSVFVDVSCDTSNPNNPFPIYNTTTTLTHPVLHIGQDEKQPLDVIAIDHLPSLVPNDSSAAFSADILPSLLKFDTPQDSLYRVWQRAETLFHEKVKTLPASSQ